MAKLHAANAARRAANQRRDPVLMRLLTPNQWRHIHNGIIRLLNETEFANLLQASNRIMRANLLNNPPPRKKVCEALKGLPVNNQGDYVAGQHSACWITSQNFPPPSLRPCEGPSLGLVYPASDATPPMHHSTFEICADCSNDALFSFPPLAHLKVSPLCRFCSRADGVANRFPQSWTCRCVTPFSSNNVRARLCHRCRDALCQELERRALINMATKLPVLHPWIPVAARDQRRWRVRSQRLGGWHVGCRGCQRGARALVETYLANPLNYTGPFLPSTSPRYENPKDRAWQFQAQRDMVFKCLECDGNVGWRSKAFRSVDARTL